MSKGRIVIALGGNALEKKGMPATAEAQFEVVRETCRHLARIEKSGWDMAIVHGNGPQVGRLLLASETAKHVTPVLPFDVCGAMSQGYIGYHIQLAMKEALKEIGKGYIPVSTLVTQVIVDSGDPGFRKPSKPIGPFYSKEEAEQLTAERGYSMQEDPAGRGWRRVVASPEPKRIVERDTIKRLWDSTILIACGGGGIPTIINDKGELQGVDAVIDKDFAAELLAEEVEADLLMILTEVEKVSLHFNTPQQQDLSCMSVEEAWQYIKEGHFAPGSMLPKVSAGVKFVNSGPGRKAIITSLDKALDALEGRTGTVIQA